MSPDRATTSLAALRRDQSTRANTGGHSPGTGRRLDPDELGCHITRLYRAAYGLCGSRHDAEDLVQETYELVLRRPRLLHRDDDLAYLMRTLRNAWVSKLRKRRVSTVVLVGDAIDNIEASVDPIEQSIQAGAVYQALTRLTEPLREAVVAVDVLGLSYNEAARALGTKEGTIMSRLHRGRGQIAAALGSHG
jgi:RNA polymerase sigma-70 factor (ECF subfamily)